MAARRVACLLNYLYFFDSVPATGTKGQIPSHLGFGSNTLLSDVVLLGARCPDNDLYQPTVYVRESTFDLCYDLTQPRICLVTTWRYTILQTFITSTAAEKNLSCFLDYKFFMIPR